jgi:NADH:ubiquinone oxidoreductase subunit 6 (subunit J)
LETINWHSCFFLLFALLAGCFAVAVVLSGRIVRMACYLVVSLGAVAGLFFLAGADFLGAVQLMIYVGGTMVLLVFGVMLTGRERFASLKTPGGHWIIAAIAGGSLLAVLLQVAVSVDDWAGPVMAEKTADGAEDAKEKAAEGPPLKTEATTTPVGLGLLGARVDKLQQEDETLREGMSGYLLPFEIVSVHLVVVLIGAAYLARARRRKDTTSFDDSAGQSPPRNARIDD